MNERIKLPAQEWLGYDPERGDIHGYTSEQMRKFAELIVQECLDVISRSAIEAPMSQYYSKQILQQFEIKGALNGRQKQINLSHHQPQGPVRNSVSQDIL